LAVLAAEALRRRFFGNSFIWAQDVAYMLYATHFLLGSAFTLKRSGHIRTDFSYRKWKPRTQATADFLIYLLLFIPCLVIALNESAQFAWASFGNREKVARSAWQDGPLWLLLAMLPLGLLLWLLQSISELVKSFRVMQSGEWAPPMSEEKLPPVDLDGELEDFRSDVQDTIEDEGVLEDADLDFDEDGDTDGS